MLNFTEDQIEQLAPDAASIKAGKDQSNVKKWVNYQHNARALWGEVQGSGSTPYKTQIDLNNLAFKCSCPSKKFPCKHGLGLMFLYARAASSFSLDAIEPLWVSEWLEKRNAKAETTAAKKEEAEAPSQSSDQDLTKAEKSEKDKEKRRLERFLKVSEGAAELNLWLQDLIRTGLLTLPEKDANYFNKPALRMLDSQAKGLANMVRELGEINYYESGDLWHNRALAKISRLQLLLRTFQNIEQLPEAYQESIKVLMGWSQSKTDLLANENANIVSDNWLVLGVERTEEDDLQVERTWLFGLNSTKFALILEFGNKFAPLTSLFIEGTILDADLAYYASVVPYRAILKVQRTFVPHITTAIQAQPNWLAYFQAKSKQLEAFPWALDLPFVLHGTKVIVTNDQRYICDENGQSLPISPDFGLNQFCQLMAITGGESTTMFMLPDNNTCRPLGLISPNSYEYIAL
jgi:hypothetical protein